jgi:hypothetical protein
VDKDVEFVYCPTDLQFADIFIKPLDEAKLFTSEISLFLKRSLDQFIIIGVLFVVVKHRSFIKFINILVFCSSLLRVDLS